MVNYKGEPGKSPKTGAQTYERTNGRPLRAATAGQCPGPFEKAVRRARFRASRETGLRSGASRPYGDSNHRGQPDHRTPGYGTGTEVGGDQARRLREKTL